MVSLTKSVNRTDILNTLVTYVIDDIAELSMNVNLIYEAYVEYKDYENAYYDKEEHEYLFFCKSSIF